jgi:hypothetical protein
MNLTGTYIMPNVNVVYQSQFLNAGQLKGQARRVTIEGAAVEVLGQGERAAQKIVLKFSNVKPRLPLGKKNATRIASAWGPDTGNWIGHVIVLKLGKAFFNGAFVDSIEVDIPGDAAPQPAAAPPQQPAPQDAAAAPASPSSLSGVVNMADDLPW